VVILLSELRGVVMFGISLFHDTKIRVRDGRVTVTGKHAPQAGAIQDVIEAAGIRKASISIRGSQVICKGDAAQYTQRIRNALAAELSL
jgi:hypothetical protein